LLCQVPLGRAGDWGPSDIGEKLASSFAELLCPPSSTVDAVGGCSDESSQNVEVVAILMRAIMGSDIPRPSTVSPDGKGAASRRPPAYFLAERLVMGGQALPALVGLLAEGRPESARLAAADCIFHLAAQSELSKVCRGDSRTRADFCDRTNSPIFQYAILLFEPLQYIFNRQSSRNSETRLCPNLN
jgi:hypothetical protein